MAKLKSRAMWVWRTKELFLDETKRGSFFDFCKRKKISEIFSQLQLSYKNENTENVVCDIEYKNEISRFIKEATSKGIKVHGLDGHPVFALRENHPKALSIIRAVIDFNKSSKPEERFYGMHFDNEPYLLPGFKTAERGKIMEEFLALNEKCARLIQAKGKNLVYGADITFWFTESFGFKLIDICDNTAVMDYRNFAQGPDGIIAHGLDVLKYAAGKGKKIYIGVETGKIEPAKTTFAGMSEEQFEGVLKEAENKFLRYSSYKAFAIHSYESYRELCNEPTD